MFKRLSIPLILFLIPIQAMAAQYKIPLSGGSSGASNLNIESLTAPVGNTAPYAYTGDDCSDNLLNPSEVAELNTWSGETFTGTDWCDNANYYLSGTGPMPDAIGGLTNANYISLSNANLTEINPAFSNLTQLTAINISDNDFPTFPSEIFSLTNLEYLYASKNGTVTIPSGISSLVNLKQLYLNQNEIVTLPDSFGSMADLNYVTLYDNNLISVPETLANRPEMKTLYLHVNQLNTVPDSLALLPNFINKTLAIYLYSNPGAAFSNVVCGSGYSACRNY
jgi:Leucine-rich repeat (LRR) protein